MLKLVRELLPSVLDLVYPNSCFQCETVEPGRFALCSSCFDASMRITEGYCDVCGEDFEGLFSQNPVCPNCHKLSYSFQYAKSALKNTEKNRQLLLAFKYGKKRYLAAVLAKFCAEVVREDPRFSGLPAPLLVPVPLHWRRKFMRGFNQAELIAREIARQTGVPAMNVLRRKRYTTTQTRLTRAERMKNLKEAFMVRGDVAGYRSIILIDDVFTTGSTSEGCANLIRKEFPNVENIVVLTALRG